MKLTKEQVREAYQCIINQNAEFVAAFAEVAVEAACETQAALWIDAKADDKTFPLPDVSDAKNMASDFVTDMLKDFGELYRRRVAGLNPSITHELSCTIQF